MARNQLIWGQDTLRTVDGFEPAAVTETSVSIDTVVYLRAQFDCGTGKARFFYSTDNKEYVQLGSETTFRFNLSVFVGARFGIFNYATQALGGYVDVDWFTTEEQFEENTYFDPDFEGYSEDMLTMQSLSVRPEIGSNDGQSEVLGVDGLPLRTVIQKMWRPKPSMRFPTRKCCRFRAVWSWGRKMDG